MITCRQLTTASTQVAMSLTPLGNKIICFLNSWKLVAKWIVSVWVTSFSGISSYHPVLRWHLLYNILDYLIFQQMKVMMFIVSMVKLVRMFSQQSQIIVRVSIWPILHLMPDRVRLVKTPQSLYEYLILQQMKMMRFMVSMVRLARTKGLSRLSRCSVRRASHCKSSSYLSSTSLASSIEYA